MELKDINVNFDFTTDTPHYWDGYWELKDGMGSSKMDPDSRSPMMRRYHQLLWSKPLPNGEVMELEDGRSKFYLKYNDLYLGSDSITVSFRYARNMKLIKEVARTLPDYRAFMEDFVRKSYTIGGEIIFPGIKGGMNQSRGCNRRICDRWDLTLECIRRYYKGEESPLSKTMDMPENKRFFDLFVDFKGYVDFFYLQDCVSPDYKSVLFWYMPQKQVGLFDDIDLHTQETYSFSIKDPMPDTVERYLAFIDLELDFLQKRNERIKDYCQARAI